jgi:hypothetical protein
MYQSVTEVTSVTRKSSLMITFLQVIAVCGERDNVGFTTAGPNNNIRTAASAADPALAVGDPSMGAGT